MGSLNRFTAPPLAANLSSSGPPTWHVPHPAHPVNANASQIARRPCGQAGQARPHGKATWNQTAHTTLPANSC